MGRLPTDYSAIITEIASRGVIVVMFAPPGDGGSVILADGRIVPPGIPDEHMVARLAEDISFIRRRLGALEFDMSWPFRGALDLVHVGAFGHAAGGAAAFLAAREDTTLRAAANIDGDMIGAAAIGGAHQPLLYLSTQPAGLDGIPVEQWSAADRTERRRDGAWSDLASSSRQPIHARVLGVFHGNFVDAALLPASALPVVLRNRRTGRINPSRGLLLTSQVIAEFFLDAFTGTNSGMNSVSLSFPEARIVRDAR